MNWYAAHAIMYVKFKDCPQDKYPIWENILLVEAQSDQDAMAKAIARAKEDEGDSEGTFTWEGRPATWCLGGIRKLVTCEFLTTGPADGTEITYLELEVSSHKDFMRFLNGETIMVKCSGIEEFDTEVGGPQLTRFSIPTQTEQEDFLAHLYFGAGSNYLQLCIRRAYLDFSRTLHGISRRPDLYKIASAEVEKAFIKLRDSAKITTQADFDKWHRATCDHLCLTYTQHHYSDFYVGQAQKWLNMTLKYIYVIGDKRLPGYSHLYGFGHIPLDKKIIKRLQLYNPPTKLPSSWSRLEDYEEYLHIQHWIRDAFADLVPLAVEFRLWQAGEG